MFYQPSIQSKIAARSPARVGQARVSVRWLLADGASHHLGLSRVLVGCYALGWLLVTTPELLGLADFDPARFESVGVVGPTGTAPLPVR